MENNKTVILFERDELAQNYKHREGAQFLNKNIDIVSCDYDVDEWLQKHSIYPVGRPQKGDTYIQSPFDKNVYVLCEELEDYILGVKTDAISNIVRRLGAKSFEFNIEIEKIEERKIDVNTGIEIILKGDLNVDVKNKYNKDLKKKFETKDIFSNPVRPSIKEWEDTQKIAKECGLLGDPSVVKFLAQRRPDDRNILQSTEVSFCMSSEINRSLGIVANLNVMKSLKIKSDIQRTTTEKKTILGVLKVEF